MTLILELYVFVLAGFVGFMVITKVPPLLHTPLMSATNAISGISLVGSMVAAGSRHGSLATLLGSDDPDGVVNIELESALAANFKYDATNVDTAIIHQQADLNVPRPCARG